MSKIRKISATILASVSLFSASIASAATFTPAGSWTFSGTVQVQKGAGPILNCTATATFTVPEAAPDGDGTFSHGHTLTGPTTLALGAGDPLCVTVQITSNPHSSSLSGDQVTIASVFADTTITPGDCAGNLVATLVEGPPTPYLDVNAVLPEVGAGTGDCSIVGALDLVSPSGGTVTL